MEREFEGMVGRIEAYGLAQAREGWFVLRLARDNAWSLGFANRVVREYQRFLALAAGSDCGSLTPSAAVDKAWHLHILDTAAYAEFCQNALGCKFLHHRPGRGSAHELEQFAKEYASTLDAYRSSFGEEPPAEIWPTVAERFGSRSAFELAAERCMRRWSGPQAGTVWLLAALLLAVPSYAAAADGGESGCSAANIGGTVLAFLIFIAMSRSRNGGGGDGDSGGCGCGG